MQMYDLRIGLIFICTLALLSSFGHWMPEPAEDGTFEPFGPLDAGWTTTTTYPRFPFEKFSP